MAQIYGFLQNAQLENVAGDKAETLSGLIWFNTVTSSMKFYDSGAVRTVADLNSTQTIINKIITGNQIASFSPDGVETITAPVVSGNMLVDQHQLTYMDALHQTTPASPAAGGVRIYSKNDNLLYKLDSEGNEVAIGTGGGGLDVFHIEDFEVNNAADFSTGNNAAFLGGGVLAGTLTDETVSPMAGKRTLKYTQAAGSLNDYFASPVFDIDPKQAGNDAGVTLYFKYDGNADDIKLAVYDVDNTNVISSDLDLIQDANNPTRFSVSVFVPAGVTQLRWGAQVVVENIGAILEIDDCEFSSDPFSYKKLVDREFIAFDGFDSRSSGNIKFKTEVKNTSGGVILLDNTLFTKVSALRNCTVNVQSNTAQGVGYNHTIAVYNGSNILQYKALANAQIGVETNNGINYELDAGDYIVVEAATDPIDSTSTSFNITAIAESEHVVAPARDPGNIFSAIINGLSGTPVITSQTSDFIDSIDDNGVGDYTVNFKPGIFSVPPHVNVTPEVFATHAQIGTSPTVSSVNIRISNNDNNTAQDGTIHLTVTKQGVDVKYAQFLAAVPVQKTAYLKDIKASGVGGGTSSTNTVHTRTLNTALGDTEIVSLSANQFTLAAGKYNLDGIFPCHNGDRHQGFIYNVTDSVYPPGLEGSSQWARSSVEGVEPSHVSGQIEITKTTIFEARHWVQNGYPTTGLGVAVDYDPGSGSSNCPQTGEVYTQLKITKLR